MKEFVVVFILTVFLLSTCIEVFKISFYIQDIKEILKDILMELKK